MVSSSRIGKILFFLVLVLPGLAHAQVEHTLVRRIAVFPIKAPAEITSIAEDAWWEMREELTKDKRFLVASKNFLMQKDVYQARSVLSPADAIILGKLLDANALVTTYVDDKSLNMKVYEGDYGRLLWEKELLLQPSLPLAEQLKPAVIKLVRDFVASVPYNGFVIVDPLKGSALYQEGHQLLIKAEIGTTAEVDVGDPVQLIRVYSDNLRPMFVNGATTEVFAEGRVVERNREVITVQLDRLNKDAPIKAGTLVRLPKELKRLEALYSIQDSLQSKISPEFFSPGMTATKQEEAEKKPLVASLVFIGNLAAFLLLAF